MSDKGTKDAISITKHLDGARNTILYVSGNIKSEVDSTFSLVDLEELVGCPKSLRLDNICFLIEDGLRILLSYKDEPYILPLSGKGKVELDPFGGLIGHDMNITLKGVGAFFISIDISKLGV
jgi:hypothetical protein